MVPKQVQHMPPAAVCRGWRRARIQAEVLFRCGSAAAEAILEVIPGSILETNMNFFITCGTILLQPHLVYPPTRLTKHVQNMKELYMSSTRFLQPLVFPPSYD